MATSLGIIDLVWRGVKLPVKEKTGEVTIGGLQQDKIITGRSVDYFAEMVASTVKATVPLRAGMDVSAIWGAGTGELQVLCDTGQTFTFDDAFLTNRPNFKAGGGGDMDLEWAAGVPTTLLS